MTNDEFPMTKEAPSDKVRRDESGSPRTFVIRYSGAGSDSSSVHAGMTKEVGSRERSPLPDVQREGIVRAHRADERCQQLHARLDVL